MSKTINETVQLTVFKNSPHIWAGGLEDEELAKWLIGKANSILYVNQCKTELSETRERFIQLQASEDVMNLYANLGVSQLSQDPIPPLSREAIHFEKDLGNRFRNGPTLLRHQGELVPPLGYLSLPDLHGAQEELQQKKELISQTVSTLCVRKPID